MKPIVSPETPSLIYSKRVIQNKKDGVKRSNHGLSRQASPFPLKNCLVVGGVNYQSVF